MSMMLVGEFVGTSILLYAVSKYGTPLAVGLALALSAYFFGHLSGGHYNPAVSMMKYIQGSVSQMMMMKYVAVQLLAAYVMVKFIK